MAAKGKVDKFSWSTCGEIYYGAYDSLEAAAQAYFDENPDPKNSVLVGRQREPDAPENIIAARADDVLEMVDLDEDYCVEVAEGWLNPTKAQMQDLAERLRKAVGAWFNKHRLRPDFHIIDDPEKWICVEGKAVPEHALTSQTESGEA